MKTFINLLYLIVYLTAQLFLMVSVIILLLKLIIFAPAITTYDVIMASIGVIMLSEKVFCILKDPYGQYIHLPFKNEK